MKKTLLFTCLLAMTGFAFALTGTAQDRLSNTDRYGPKPGAIAFIKNTSNSYITVINWRFSQGDASHVS